MAAALLRTLRKIYSSKAASLVDAGMEQECSFAMNLQSSHLLHAAGVSERISGT